MAMVFPVRGTGPRQPFGTLTYAELDARTDALAHGFAEVGFARGMKTVLMVKPGPELFTILLALFKLGAPPVVLHRGLGLKRMLQCYKAVGAQAFVGIPAANVIRAFALPTVKLKVTAGARWSLTGPTVSGLIQRGMDKGPFPVEEPDADEPLMIHFTTGSTGPTKGVEMTHDALSAMCEQVRDTYGTKPGDVGLVTLPLFAILDVLNGCTSVLPPIDLTRPADASPRIVVETIERFAARHLLTSPALLHRVSEHALRHSGALSSLRTVVSGGATAPLGVLERFRGALPAGAKLHTTYGATEALPIASIELEQIPPPSESPVREGGVCMGRPVSGAEVRIMRVTGATAEWRPEHAVSAGTVGEILVKGPLVSRSYHQNPAANSRLKVAEGAGVWHRTGDLGSLDAEGRLWFCGRQTECVTPEAGPLFTEACESIFNQHPAVFRSALVGLGPKGRQIPVVCLECHRDHGRDLDTLVLELRALARRHFSTRSIKDFVFHPQFPVDIRHNSKINRGELRVWAGAQLELIDIPRASKWVRAVPVAGWLYLAVAPFFFFSHPLVLGLWWVVLALSVGVHLAQLPLAFRAGQRVGHSRAQLVFLTLLYGATYWKPLANVDAGALSGSPHRRTG